MYNSAPIKQYMSVCGYSFRQPKCPLSMVGDEENLFKLKKQLMAAIGGWNIFIWRHLLKASCIQQRRLTSILMTGLVNKNMASHLLHWFNRFPNKVFGALKIQKPRLH